MNATLAGGFGAGFGGATFARPGAALTGFATGFAITTLGFFAGAGDAGLGFGGSAFTAAGLASGVEELSGVVEGVEVEESVEGVASLVGAGASVEDEDEARVSVGVGVAVGGGGAGVAGCVEAVEDSVE